MTEFLSIKRNNEQYDIMFVTAAKEEKEKEKRLSYLIYNILIHVCKQVAKEDMMQSFIHMLVMGAAMVNKNKAQGNEEQEILIQQIGEYGQGETHLTEKTTNAAEIIYMISVAISQLAPTKDERIKIIAGIAAFWELSKKENFNYMDDKHFKNMKEK